MYLEEFGIEVFVITKQGSIFSHFDSSLVGSDLSEIMSPTEAVNKPVFNYVSNDELPYDVYGRINHEGSEFFGFCEKFENWDLSLFFIKRA